MKKNIYCLLMLVSLILITGCTKNYDIKDIKKYVNENLKIRNIEVLNTYQEIIDEDGYTDKIWTVIDKENNITFHVIDDYFWGMESGTNRLLNDYDESVFVKLYDKMDVKENIIYNHETDNFYNEVDLLCKYKDKKGLIDCYNSLLYYKDYIESQNYNLAITYNITYDSVLKNIGQHKRKTGDTFGQLNDLDKNELDEAMYNYLSTALIFQIENGIKEITEEDMKQILENEKTNLIFIKKDDGSKKQYDDIIAYYSYISFGTLYKILEKEGFNPVGNPWHYTVTNKNGDNFEFSYDFNDYVYSYGSIGYYYKRNSEKIRMGRYSYNYFNKREITEMFGIDIETITKRFLHN